MELTQPKIPCSVALLTLNAEPYLATCLESLKDFGEIIVADGNSTDRTREIALAYGAKVIKQYDTDEPNVRCDRDKATVRQRAMDASSMPWRFFMDADDTLPQETVNEIRHIIASSSELLASSNYKLATNLIWRMPSEIVLEGPREVVVRHYATYPAYQTRLVHESVGAVFKGKVHDHLVWDSAAFPVGTMKSHYTFHWPEDRVKHFWKYQKRYIGLELDTVDWPSVTFGELVRWWILHRLRIIAGYTLYRIPKLYLTHGTHAIPCTYEFMIVGYHFGLLFGGIARYLKTR